MTELGHFDAKSQFWLKFCETWIFLPIFRKTDLSIIYHLFQKSVDFFENNSNEWWIIEHTPSTRHPGLILGTTSRLTWDLPATNFFLIFTPILYFLFSSSLCTDSKLEKQVPDICIAIKYKIKVPECFFTDDGIRWDAGCKKDIGVNLKDEQGVTQRFPRDVGLCKLSRDTTKCVTKGVEPNTIYHYSYDSTNKLCSDPIEITYNFPVSWTRIFSFLSCLKFWWRTKLSANCVTIYVFSLVFRKFLQKSQLFLVCDV